MSRRVDIDERAASAFAAGRSHEAKGELAAAQGWYQEAADYGHRAAAALLGVLLASDSVASGADLEMTWWGDPYALQPAEELWRRALRGIDAAAAREVGRLLGWGAGCIEAEYRLRVAYEAGDPMAGYRLGRLLEERGSGDEREYGWLNEADAAYTAVQRCTDSASRAVHRRAGSSWYPGWRLRQILWSGRVPWGINANDLRARVYAAVRVQKPWLLGPWIEPYARPRLERDHAAGDPEATFLRGIWALADDDHDAHRWLRLAADDGHRQAAFELGMYEQAADAGHPGAAYELAWTAVRVGDPGAAEEACHKAAHAGHLRAAALLRILQRRGMTAEPAAFEDRRIGELLAAWDELNSLAPEPDSSIDYLADRSGLPRVDIERVRRVRNKCAHPAERGWPGSTEIDQALATAGELRRRVGLRPETPE